MVLDNIKSSVNHLYERLSSPFGGTFISLWIVHHWQLVYSFFTFDDDCLLNDRICILQLYLDKSDINSLFFYPLGNTFIVITLYLLLSHVGYAISVFFNKWAKPTIYFYLDRNKNASRSDLDRIKKQLLNAYDRLEKTKDDAQFAIEEKEKTEKIAEELRTSLINFRSIQRDDAEQKDKLNKELNVFRTQLEGLRQDAVDKEKQLIDIYKEINGEHLDKLQTIFKGKWKNTFTFKNGTTGNEIFNIDDNNCYVIDSKRVFIIGEIFYHKEKQYLEFTKFGIEDTSKRVKNLLIQINENLFLGSEPDGTIVKYEKIRK